MIAESFSLPTPDINAMQVFTDKDVYHSKEQMDIEVHIDSAHGCQKLQLAVYGLDTGTKPRIYEVIPLNLTKGNNMIRMGYTLPSCNTCSGIPAGDYEINAELYFNNSLVYNATMKIRLEQ